MVINFVKYIGAHKTGEPSGPHILWAPAPGIDDGEDDLDCGGGADVKASCSTW